MFAQFCESDTDTDTDTGLDQAPHNTGGRGGEEEEGGGGIIEVARCDLIILFVTPVVVSCCGSSGSASTSPAQPSHRAIDTDQEQASQPVRALTFSPHQQLQGREDSPGLQEGQ